MAVDKLCGKIVSRRNLQTLLQVVDIVELNLFLRSNKIVLDGHFLTTKDHFSLWITVHKEVRYG